MAIKRINLPDAIDNRINLLARARTAIVRRGVITVPPNVSGVAKVTIGGGTVDAVCFASDVLAANDQVVVLADTDAFWVVGKVGVGLAPVPTLPVIGDYGGVQFAAATGFSVDAVTKGRVITLGDARWVHLHLQPTRTGVAIAAGANGNIGDTVVLTLPTPLIPSERIFCHWTANGVAGSGYITAGSGTFVICDMYPSQSLAQSAVFNCDVYYSFVNS